jgi:hypothetical protein
VDHSEAVKSQAVERYLLKEFSASERNEFEEHYFGCGECASDLRSTSAFLELAGRVIVSDRIRAPKPKVLPFLNRWQPLGYAIAASLACLSIVLYQNILVIPKLRSSASPQALQYFSLIDKTARGSVQMAFKTEPGKPFLLLVDLPPHEAVGEYRCEISNLAGRKVLSFSLSKENTQNTVPLLIPAASLERGVYSISISGRSTKESAYTEIQTLHFEIK